MNRNIEQLWDMVLDYSGEMQCDIPTAINDLEFDGPNGSYGPTKEEKDALMAEYEAANDLEQDWGVDPNAEELKSYIPGVGFLVTNLGTGESHLFDDFDS